MGSAITLSRNDYVEGLERIQENAQDGTSYLDKFSVTFPDGLNTVETLEICRAVEDPSLDTKVHLARLCMAKKNVEVKCPNGETEKFCIADPDASLGGIPLFVKEPLAIMAISDAIYGHLLKKYLRLSTTPKTGTAEAPAT